MASSSTHTTPQETTLHTLWRLAFIRLHSANHARAVNIITNAFAAALDVRVKELLSCYWPPGPEGWEESVAGEEWERHQMVQKSGWRLNEAQRVEEAADAVGRAGECLVRYGRVGEGVAMEKMGRELHELAIKIAKRDGYNGADESDGDSEMTDAESTPRK